VESNVAHVPSIWCLDQVRRCCVGGHCVSACVLYTLNCGEANVFVGESDGRAWLGRGQIAMAKSLREGTSTATGSEESSQVTDHSNIGRAQIVDLH
jgi:hypothetical protein